MSLDQRLSELQNDVTPESLSKFTRDMENELKQVSPDSQKALSTLITEILPELSESLPPQVYNVFASLTGLSTLVFNIKTLTGFIEAGNKRSKTQSQGMLKELKTTYTDVNQVKSSVGKQVVFLLVFLSKVMKRTRLDSVYKGLNQAQSNELTALLAGSSIFSTVAYANQILFQHSITVEDYDKYEWLTEKVKYGNYFVSELLLSENRYLPKLLFKLLRLLGVSFLEQINESIEGLKKIQLLVQHLSGLEQKAVLVGYILPFFEQQSALGKALDAGVVARFIYPMSNRSSISAMMGYAEKSNSVLIKQTVVAVSSQNIVQFQTDFVDNLRQWGDPLNIKHLPESIQRSQTQILFLSIDKLSREFLRKVSSSSEYMNAISNRIGALSEFPRLFGMALAELVSSLIDNEKPLDFGSVGSNFKEEMDYWRNDFRNVKVLFDEGIVDEIPKKLFKSLHQFTHDDDDDDIEEIVRDTPSSLIFEEASDSDDGDESEFKQYSFDSDDAEDSDDDPSLIRKHPIKAPVYIKDLLAYLNDTSAETGREKIEIGIRTAPKLIQQKAKFGKELQFYAKELATTLVGLKFDGLDEEDSEDSSLNDLRLEALAVLVASEPFGIPGHLAGLLIVGDYSIMQRMIILSSITLGASILHQKKPDQEVFASKQLPKQLHDRFTPTKTNTLTAFNMKSVDREVDHIQRELTMESREKAQDELLGSGKVVRLSSTLQKQRANIPMSSSTSSINLYAKLAYKQFFLPLINQWYGMPSQKLIGGAYNELFLAHYIKSLSLLVNYAYPSQVNESMSTDLIRIVLTHRATQEVHIQEALFTAVLTVLKVNPGEAIASRWAREVCVEIKGWLESVWESIPDERVRGLAASALYQIAEIGEKWQRRLIGEMMALESEGGRDIKIM